MEWLRDIARINAVEFSVSVDHTPTRLNHEDWSKSLLLVYHHVAPSSTVACWRCIQGRGEQRLHHHGVVTKSVEQLD
jgi:hypothetical protein